MEKRLNKNGSVSRRDFIKTSAAVGMTALLSGTDSVFAQGQKKLRIALIGCGGRGRGALKDCMDAGKHIGLELEVVATVTGSRTELNRLAGPTACWNRDALVEPTVTRRFWKPMQMLC